MNADISDPNVYGRAVPHAEFARRRQESPVSWVDEVSLERRSRQGTARTRGAGYWCVTTHALVVAVSRQPEVFSSAAQGAFLSDPKSREDLERNRQLLINMDAPEHLVVRRFVGGVFTNRLVQGLRDSIARHVHEIIERVQAAGEFDAVRAVCAELPLLVLCDLLGIVQADRSAILAWSNDIVGFDDAEYGGGDADVYRRALGNAVAYAGDEIVARRRSPRDDLLSQITHCEIDGRRLTDAELRFLWILLVIGGNESTRHLLSGSLLALAEWPQERDRLIADGRLMRTAVDELLRWVSPVMHFRRTASVDTELGGQKIRAGDKVVLCYISANRDETVFAEPQHLRLDRSPNPHLAFGVGPHFCLGAALARLEAAVLLDALRPHLLKWRIDGPAQRMSSNFMNGLKSLRIRIES